MVPEQYPSNGELLAKIDDFAREYQEIKLGSGLADYDDLLVYCLEVLQTIKRPRHPILSKPILSYPCRRISGRKNSLQAQIVDKIGINTRSWQSSDDAQCIYTWRGADLDQIMGFPEKHPGTKFSKSRPITLKFP